jgi:hypothetical protein
MELEVKGEEKNPEPLSMMYKRIDALFFLCLKEFNNSSTVKDCQIAPKLFGSVSHFSIP